MILLTGPLVEGSECLADRQTRALKVGHPQQPSKL